jgi:small basic protein (TIGR04137 family)
MSGLAPCRSRAFAYLETCESSDFGEAWAMSIDKSLKKKSSLARARNVLRRGERITKLKEQDKWDDEKDPYGLPKVRVFRIVAKKAKKKKEEPAAGADDKKAKKK